MCQYIPMFCQERFCAEVKAARLEEERFKQEDAINTAIILEDLQGELDLIMKAASKVEVQKSACFAIKSVCPIERLL